MGINFSFNINLKSKKGLAIIAIVFITAIFASSAIMTEIAEQSFAQQINKETAYVTDINVHFKTACISVIFFTYCW